MPDEKHHIEEFDHRMHYRCPMLGGEVPFRYCRTLTEGKPCRRIEACWGDLMDVQAFLEAHYDLDELREIWDRSKKPKIDSILEILQQVKKDPQE
jgi:hypothetical protein